MAGDVIGQNMEANKALLERLFWHMVGIVNLVRRSQHLDSGRLLAWQEIGTGAACQFRGSKLILTAKHVLEGAGLADLQFLPRPTGRIEWAGEPREGRRERIPLDIDRVVYCDWEDLAAIVLSSGVGERERIEFCDLPGKFGAPPESGTCLVIGYPYDQAFVAEVSAREDGRVHNLSVRSDGFWGEVVAPDRVRSGFDPNIHFLVRFHPSFPNERPDGYSGAGVWFSSPESKEGTVWRANVSLTGVLTHAYRDSGLLRVVRSSAVRSFLEESFPEPA